MHLHLLLLFGCGLSGSLPFPIVEAAETSIRTNIEKGAVDGNEAWADSPLPPIIFAVEDNGKTPEHLRLDFGITNRKMKFSYESGSCSVILTVLTVAISIH